MNDTVFGREYANQYDLLYDHKDYEAECDLLEEVFQRYADGPVHTILDLGCGTGSHALVLTQRGYQVTGVDLSQEMMDRARQKAASNGDGAVPGNNGPTFHQGDMRTVDLGRQFDVVLMMFAVLGYQIGNHDVMAALGNTRQHLRPGGLLIFDVWYGPAVLAIRPGDRVKVVDTEDGSLIRVASGALDERHHLGEVRYQLWRLAGDRVIEATKETHRVRFFFPMELELFLAKAGFELINLTAFPDLAQSADETTWNVLTVGKLPQEISE